MVQEDLSCNPQESLFYLNDAILPEIFESTDAPINEKEVQIRGYIDVAHIKVRKQFIY